jgi:elongation factor Ts
MSIELIKKLRELTNSGMLECKNALIEANHDFDQAVILLSKNKIEDTNKKRVAAKGLTSIVIKQNEAILFEINALTDFVAKNEHFIKLVKDLGHIFIKSTVNNKNDALKLIIDEVTVLDKIKNVSNIIKEEANLRRFYRILKSDQESFGSYIHQGGRVSTLVIINIKDEKLANDLAMQVAANEPKYISLDQIDLDTMNYEKFMFEKKSGYYDESEFMTFMQQNCLLSQKYIKNDLLSVNELLKEKNAMVIDFFRFELGQGIEDKLNCKLDIPCDGSKITVKPVI